MKNTLAIIQIILALTVILLIFLQSNDADEGRSNFLSSAKIEKRGWEKILFNLTLALLTIFVISSIIQTLI